MCLLKRAGVARVGLSIGERGCLRVLAAVLVKVQVDGRRVVENEVVLAVATRRYVNVYTRAANGALPFDWGAVGIFLLMIVVVCVVGVHIYVSSSWLTRQVDLARLTDFFPSAG